MGNKLRTIAESILSAEEWDDVKPSHESVLLAKAYLAEHSAGPSVIMTPEERTRKAIESTWGPHDEWIDDDLEKAVADAIRAAEREACAAAIRARGN